MLDETKLSSELKVKALVFLEVVVRLDYSEGTVFHTLMPGTSRTLYLRQRFDEVFGQIRKFIEDSGGEIMESVWLNKSVRLRASLLTILQLTQFPEVKKVDYPSNREFEVSGDA